MSRAAAAWTDADERRLARSIFGVEDRTQIETLIADWVRGQEFAPVAVTDLVLSIGAVATVALASGDLIVVKAWPGVVDPRGLAAQTEVQRRLALRGFPAPAVLSPPAALGGGVAVAMAMAHDCSGEATDARRPEVRRAMAAGLARLIAETDDLRDLDGLPRYRVPAADAIWPIPHTVLFDFAATRDGAESIDALGAEALAVLRSAGTRIVLGHNDWSAKNMRVGGDRVTVVYDWDSVLLAPEAVIVGTAAAHFPMTWELDVPATPSPAESIAFVRDYEQARGQAFSASELGAVAAGITYARAYTARCEHAIGAEWRGSSRELLAAQGAFRFAP